MNASSNAMACCEKVPPIECCREFPAQCGDKYTECEDIEPMGLDQIPLYLGGIGLLATGLCYAHKYRQLVSGRRGWDLV